MTSSASLDRCRGLARAGRGRGQAGRAPAVGRDLRHALKLAARTDPGTLGHCAAWDKADDATERMGRLIGSDERTATIVMAARGRLLATSRARRR